MASHRHEAAPCGCMVVTYDDGSTPDLYHCDRHRLVDDLTDEHVADLALYAGEKGVAPSRLVYLIVAGTLAVAKLSEAR